MENTFLQFSTHHQVSILHISTTCNSAIHRTLTFFWYHYTKKLKFSIKDFFSKCDQIRSFLRIWLHLLKKSFMENLIFYVVYDEYIETIFWNISPRFHRLITLYNFFITKSHGDYNKIRQLFYYQMRQKFNTKDVRVFVTKGDFYYNIRSSKNIALV